jgi:hypothetical protein
MILLPIQFGAAYFPLPQEEECHNEYIFRYGIQNILYFQWYKFYKKWQWIENQEESLSKN